MNYKEADALLSGRCKESRKLENNTYLERRGSDIAVVLHNTDVVTFHNDDTVTLDSGGWRTPTTKDRINKYSPVSVFQVSGQWYVSENGEQYAYGFKKSKLSKYPIFQDGMQIKNGCVIKPKCSDKYFDKNLKLIDRYCKALKELDALPYPGGGDCWICLMFDQEKKAGEKSETSHLMSHLEEKYIHGSLILNALRWQGYVHPEFVFQMDHRESIVRAVRGYFKAHFGIAR